MSTRSARIEHETELELYHYGESLCSQMVRIALEEKQLEWTSHSILLSEVALAGDNLTPEYLRINPKGQVPTLVHDGQPVFDSWEIIRHLDRVWPESGERLVPNDPELEAAIASWTDEAALREDLGFGKTLGTSIPILSSRIIQDCIRQLPVWRVMWKFRRHPVFDRRMSFRLVRVLPLPSSISRSSMSQLAKALVNVERTLPDDDQAWLLGPFTMVDVMLMAHFHRIEDVALGGLLDHSLLPKTAAYWRRLQIRPSYSKAVVAWHEPHWRDAIKRVHAGAPSPILGEIEARINRFSKRA